MQSKTPPPPSPLLSPSSSGGPVLIVDDQRLSLVATAAVVADVLPGRGLLFADGVADALVVLDSLSSAERSLGCAILDISLADGDGFMVLAAIRDRGHDCPAIFYTAHSLDGAASTFQRHLLSAPGAVLLSKDEPWLLASQLHDWFVDAQG